ncbi:hypothetical protein B0A67_15680 [Flavobacterium aquidurense]|uniref:hypothetical protein n=1 Tax=Flavobacterium aquidurense TaxID=362413 RepID=UPI000911F12A|nr:hypothetical protein [Flavobacterium aquidurense]OXA70455.1 hypothetical protein B0A67_15680 [Flavobacterium aquidurense]SHH73169.1 hypothetical protein SAMN05444481_12540 [Flavobacterium frigidimaris]
MKRQLLNTIFLITVLLSNLLNESCKNVEEQKKPEKSTNQVISPKEHACINAKEEQLPPPDQNTILSSAKLEINEENRKYFVTINLIADKLVDFNGKDQQLYKIETTNKNRTRSLYFALPIAYNKYWNELKIFPDKENKILEIGFKEKGNSKTFYKIYGYKYENEDFGDGHIEIKSNFEKDRYRIID